MSLTSATPSRRNDVIALVLLLAVSFAAGGLGSLATAPNIPAWYAGLAKPWFNPPNAVFPIVWSALYGLMAVAAWIAWRKPVANMAARWRRLIPFFVQLLLNTVWSFAFFGSHSPLAGLVVVILLDAAVAWTILVFAGTSRAAAALLLPYLAWALFATLLNAAILALN